MRFNIPVDKTILERQEASSDKLAPQVLIDVIRMQKFVQLFRCVNDHQAVVDDSKAKVVVFIEGQDACMDGIHAFRADYQGFVQPGHSAAALRLDQKGNDSFAAQPFLEESIVSELGEPIRLGPLREARLRFHEYHEPIALKAQVDRLAIAPCLLFIGGYCLSLVPKGPWVAELVIFDI